MGVVEVAVEIGLATIDELIPDVLDVREAVNSFVVAPPLYPEVELVRAYTRFQSWRLDLVYLRGRTLLSPCCVGTHVGVEECDGDPGIFMARDGATVSEGPH